MATGYDFSFEPRIVEYTPEADTADFDCGKPGINEFIRSAEATKFHELRLGHTRLVYDHETVAGYFTLAPYSFQSDAYAGTETKYAAKLHEDDELPPAIPSRLLGKLGVDQAYRDSDVGEYLMHYIIADTLERNREIPFRFLALHSHPDVVDFYKRYGFVESDSGKDTSWENTIMFLDLEKYREAGESR